MAKKIKIGITGGIGSGKSVISDFIESRGFFVLKADNIAKELVLNDDGIKKKILKTFGKNSFVDGKLNNNFLADVVFTNKENLEKINSIIHPPTIKIIEKKLNELLESNDIVFVESALIYEAKLQKMFDHVILICTDEEIRIQRSILRDNVSAEEIKKRMEFQLKDEIKKERASFVIENNTTLEDLKARIAFILNLLTTLTR